MLIRDGNRGGGRGRESEFRLDRAHRPGRPRRPWTAARTMEVLIKAVSPRHCAATSVLTTQLLFQLPCWAESQGQCPLHRCWGTTWRRKRSNFHSPAPPPCSWSLLGWLEGSAPPPSSWSPLDPVCTNPLMHRQFLYTPHYRKSVHYLMSDTMHTPYKWNTPQNSSKNVFSKIHAGQNHPAQYTLVSQNWRPKQRNKTAQPKAAKSPTSHLSPLNCCLSVVLYL